MSVPANRPEDGTDPIDESHQRAWAVGVGLCASVTGCLIRDALGGEHPGLLASAISGRLELGLVSGLGLKVHEDSLAASARHGTGRWS